MELKSIIKRLEEWQIELGYNPKQGRLRDIINDLKAMVNEQQPQPFQTDIIIRFSKLPRKGLIADFSGVGLNQLVEFHTYDFNDLAIFDMQLEHINARAKELNANFVVYQIGSDSFLKSDTYMMKFTK